MIRRSRSLFILVFAAACLCPASWQTAGAQAVRELTATRDLFIDATRADLTRVTSLLVAKNGDIIMRQMDDGRIRYFDAQGVPFTFGRRGDGPSEFRNLRETGFVGDTVWAADIALTRITFISPSRSTLRIVDYPNVITTPGRGGPVRTSAGWPAAIYSDGTRLMNASPRPANTGGGGPAGVRGAAGSAAAGTPPPASAGRASGPLAPPSWALPDSQYARPLVRTTADGQFIKVIAWRPQLPTCGESFPLSNGTGFAQRPFCAPALDAISVDGKRIAIVHSDNATTSTASYRVTVINADADTIFSRLISYRPVPIPKEKNDSVINSRIASLANRAEFARAYSTLKLHTHYPPIREVLIGRDETTWLEVWTNEGERHWQVLDPRGNLVATVKMPRNVSILAAQMNAAWGVETDTDGLNSVVRYRLR